MKSKSKLLYTFLLFFMVAMVPPCYGQAAEKSEPTWRPPQPDNLELSWVQLKNGEWMGGKIISMYDDKLEFESENFGTVKIEWRKIKKIYAKEKISAHLADNTYFDGYLQMENGKMRIVGGKNDIRTVSEKPRSFTAKDSSPWTLKGSIGINFIEGNTDQFDYKLLAHIQRRDEDTRLIADYLTFVTLEDDVLTEGTRQLSLDYDYFLEKDYFWRVIDTRYYSDKFQNIDSRLTMGTGLGYMLLDTQQSEWAMVVGLSYQRTDFESVEPGSEESETSPAFTYYTRYLVDLTEDIDFALGYDFNLTNTSSGQYQHHFSSTVSYELSKYFDFDVSFFWNRTEKPAAEIDSTIPDKDDFRLVFGIGAKN